MTPINKGLPNVTPGWLFGGFHQIASTVDRLGVTGVYRVRLFDRRTALCLRETWSTADGAYAFTHLASQANGYFVVAFDHAAGPLNAAIADLITPVPMP